jgi:hypothetical protein
VEGEATSSRSANNASAGVYAGSDEHAVPVNAAARARVNRHHLIPRTVTRPIDPNPRVKRRQLARVLNHRFSVCSWAPLSVVMPLAPEAFGPALHLRLGTPASRRRSRGRQGLAAVRVLTRSPPLAC